ncbi:hypothetical protein [Kangiella sp. HZ709]|uniref:hypothetical protein n=1 Tax=Kangiella sp. HZ709 TaxID=2666328 RepID=UPI0012B0743D|nr:hypothetical protein [Kangiella sp. HZ709]MRX27463.1 hypothetical protein [Kangiella sp. HZ709]
MKKLLLLFLLLTPNSEALEISNFKSGYACTDNETFGWICHETKDIYITGQSKCVYDGKEKPCTWHGFQFDYKSNKGEEIFCDYVTSTRINHGNPNEVLGYDDKGSYSFTLEKKEGSFYNPQYFIFSLADSEEQILRSKTECKVDNKVIFKFEHRYHFPTQN